MANLFAQASANWDAANEWNTVANGSGSFVTPGAGDVCMANNKTVTVNISPTVGEVRCDTTGSATAGGSFALNNGVTLTANVYGGSTSSTNCVTSALTSGNSASIVGNITGGTNSSAVGVNITSTGTLNVTGNVIGGPTAGGAGIQTTAGCTLSITGNVNAAAAANAPGVYSNGTAAANLTITGNVTAGQWFAVYAPSAGNQWATCTITGTVTGGTQSAVRYVGTLQINGALVCGGNFPFDTVATVTRISGPVGVSASGFSALGGAGLAPVLWINPTTPTHFDIRTATTLALRSLYTADSVGGNPAIADVRSGTVYGPTGAEITGTCAVPVAASVLYGVPTGATTGTVTIVAADIRAAIGMASANLDTQLGNTYSRIGAPVGASISADVAAVKAVDDAIKAKTDNLPASPAAVGSAMTLTSGERTAVANEVEAQIIDETDSEKVLTAITDKIAAVNPDLGGLTVAAIASATAAQVTTDHGAGSYLRNTEPVDVSANVAAIKAKTDNLPASPAAVGDIPAAATVASAVRTELATELGRVDVASSTLATAVNLATVAGYVDTEVAAIKAKTDNLPASPAATGDIPSAVTVASAVRTELMIELGRVDVAVSTRLASGSYTAPDNSGVAAIKAKTDNLPSDPADQSLVIAATDAVMTRLGAPAGASIAGDIADKSGYRLSSVGVDDIMRAPLTEGYADIGEAPTLEQFMHMVWAALNTKDIVGTTLTARRLDGTTTAMTFTLDKAKAPTSQVRAS